MSEMMIEKTLSANDVGETGGHQAGILVPKDPEVLAFFPELDSSIKNPRAVLDVIDDAGNEWSFNFIYYNNKFFDGTRNEYRLTGMTNYFNEFGLKTGDTIRLRKAGARTIYIDYERKIKSKTTIDLSFSWRVVHTEF